MCREIVMVIKLQYDLPWESNAGFVAVCYVLGR